MKVVVRAYLDNNFGDDLMLNLLFERFPNYTFILHTESSIVKNTFKDFNNVIINSPKQMAADAKKADVFLTIGGSIFQLKNLKQHISRMLKILFLKYLKIKGKKIVTLGANIGPLANKCSYKLVEWELRQNNLTTVRDSVSYNILRQFKRIQNFHKASDIVYNLTIPSGEKKVGLGISTYRQTKKNDNNFEVYQGLATLADKYIEKTGEKVILFSFDCEVENDLSSAHHIYELSRYKEKITIIPYLGNSNNFLNEFKMCKKMIAIRFHSAILADIFNVPFYPIAYSGKIKNLLEDAEYTGSITDIQNFSRDLDFEGITEEVINSVPLGKLSERVRSAKIHFDEFEKIMNKLK